MPRQMTEGSFLAGGLALLKGHQFGIESIVRERHLVDSAP